MSERRTTATSSACLDDDENWRNSRPWFVARKFGEAAGGYFYDRGLEDGGVVNWFLASTLG